MVTVINHTQREEAEMIWYLQRLAYTVEAQLIGFDRIPPLMDTIASIQASPETFCGIIEEDELVAAIGYSRDSDTVTICRVMVHPAHFRKGLASRLLDHVERTEQSAMRFSVSAAERNDPAVRLYQKHGYRLVGTQDITPNVKLLHVQKIRSVVQ